MIDFFFCEIQNHHAIYMHVNTDENSDQCNDRTSGFSDISNCIL